MCKLYFDNVKEILEACNTAKPLSDYGDVLCLLKDEKIQGNPYRLLAEKFQKYNSGEDGSENDDDWNFYKYLKSLKDKKHYNFPKEDGTYITVDIDLLNPIDKSAKLVEGNGKVTEFIDPKWYLVVAYYAYKDAKFNHTDNEFASKISDEIKSRLNTTLELNMRRKYMCKLYFDKVEKILKACNNAKPLSDCGDVLCLLKDEKIQGNPYRLLAEKFQKYNSGEDGSENDDDWYFYKYLDSLKDKDQYNFPKKDGTYITVHIDLLNPIDKSIKLVEGNGKVTEFIDPKWHLVVAYYAYKDAKFNHTDNEFASKISNDIKGGLNTTFKSKVLTLWMERAFEKK